MQVDWSLPDARLAARLGVSVDEVLRLRLEAAGERADAPPRTPSAQGRPPPRLTRPVRRYRSRASVREREAFLARLRALDTAQLTVAEIARATDASEYRVREALRVLGLPHLSARREAPPEVAAVDWEAVDWRLSNYQLARKLKLAPHQVATMRQRRFGKRPAAPAQPPRPRSVSAPRPASPRSTPLGVPAGPVTLWSRLDWRVPNDQLAAGLGVSVTTVARHRPRPLPEATVARELARRDAARHTAAEWGVRLGTDTVSVRRTAQRLGVRLKGDRTPAGWYELRGVADTLTPRELARLLGITPRRLHRLAKRDGVTLKRAGRPERLEQVVDTLKSLNTAHFTVAELAQRTHTKRAVVEQLLKRHGLPHR